jgi:hypothetical protein
MTSPISARGRLAGLISSHQPPEVIATARAELAQANLAAQIVRSWPPLSLEQRVQLAVLLLTGDDTPAGTR